jgi:glycine cleavage system H protein
MKQYLRTHEWVEFISETKAQIGISEYAQNALGNIVFVNLPLVGDTVEAGVAFGEVESVKTVSDVISPVTGVVSAVNQAAIDNPEQINDLPNDTWFIEVSDITACEALLSEDEYNKFCEQEAQH